jgi:alkanesulfonate monooxygenase SsuD/methylene tetrahydromethanopterin reductase-like flavin-dependent oxidoreductase (luciferase family)
LDTNNRSRPSNNILGSDVQLDFGIVLPSSLNAKQIVESAKLADELGIDFLLLTDHYLTPVSNQTVDAWTTLAGLATATETIRLGTCVTPIPFRPPQQLAKVVATVDQLSNGRTILGVGAGWHRPEFDAYSSWDEAKVRVAKTREGLDLMRKLWTSDKPVDFDGEYYRVIGSVLEPKPIQKPHPPLWFGTTGAYMLKLAARYADGWIPPVPGVPMDMYKTALKQLRENLPHQRKIKLTFNGTFDELSENLPTFAKMGFDGAVLVRTPPEALTKTIRRFASEIADTDN